jgi:hypothetical protein
MKAPLCPHGHGPKTRCISRTKTRGYDWYCQTCNLDQSAQWRERNPEKRAGYKATNRAAQQRCVERNRRIVNEEIERRGGHCERCPEPGAHWHHRDPATKVGKIASAIVSAWSVARLRAELAKCDWLCRACHIAAHQRESSATA